MRLYVDVPACEIWIDGRLIELTPTEWDVFYLLYTSGERWINDREANDVLFRNYYTPTRNQHSALKWHIANIRKKIVPLYIENRRGFGYRLRMPDDSMVQ